MGDEDVTRKSGIYEYLLTGEEKKLSIRSFDRRDALAAYEKQHHKATISNLNWQIGDAAADLIMEYGVVISPIVENREYFQQNVDILPFFANILREGVRIRA